MSLDNYYPPTEPVELLPSFVLYADILGFKSIIKENSKNEELKDLNNISSNLHRILLFEKEALEGISDVFDGNIKVFSDNYLFWIPIRDITDGSVTAGLFFPNLTGIKIPTCVGIKFPSATPGSSIWCMQDVGIGAVTGS